MTEQKTDTLLEFPCNFPIKIMGKNHLDFEAAVLAIVNQHVEKLADDALKSRASKNGNYLSITVTIVANSKNQLDSIYQALSDHELVVMAL